MTEEKKTLNLYEKLVTIRAGVQYLRKEKSALNYKYVSGSQIIGNIRSKMDELGILLKVEITSANVQERKYISEKGKEICESLVLLELAMTWINANKPEERETHKWYGMGQNSKDKGFGAAITYGERYFLLKNFLVPTDELDPDAYIEKYYDDETTQTEEKNSKKSQPKRSFSIGDVIPDELLPTELQKRSITFMALGKTPKDFVFLDKNGVTRDGWTVLQYWSKTPSHLCYNVALQVLDTASQSQEPEESGQ